MTTKAVKWMPFSFCIHVIKNNDEWECVECVFNQTKTNSSKKEITLFKGELYFFLFLN